MVFKEHIVNKLSVIPVQSGVGNWTKENTKGYDVFPTSGPYWNAFICAKKKSGKSSLINLITQKCTDKRTIIWIFCATHGIDPTWIEIKKYLNERGNLVNTFDSLMDGKTNILDEIIDEINTVDEVVEKEEPKPKQLLKFNEDKEMSGSGKKKEYKPKKTACENLFIFDDMPAIFLRNNSIARLLKIHRHSKSSVIISSQWITDIQPQAILQLDYFIAFRSLSQEKMENIHKLLDLSIEFSKFWDIYKHCTMEPYSFMWLSTRDEKFRCRLNKEIEDV